MRKLTSIVSGLLLMGGAGVAFAQNTITSIMIDEQALSNFDPAIYEYTGLTVTDGRYPAVAVKLDPAKTSVAMSLDEANYTISINATDLSSNETKTYTLKFNPFEKAINGPQIKGDFESYTVWGTDNSDKNKEGVTFDGWASSNVTQMGMKFVMVQKEVHDSNGGQYAALMKNGRPGMLGIGANAPGYITTGKTWVYADIAGVTGSIFGGSDPDDSDGGSVGGLNFSFRPDSIVGYFKRTHDTKNEHGNTDEIANIYAYLWKGTATSIGYSNGGSKTGDALQLLIDRDKDVRDGQNGATLIAKAEYNIEGDISNWTRISVPLNYVSDEMPEKVNVILSAADYYNRPNIGNGNTLSADDVMFVYNSQLTSLSLFGEPIANFSKDKYEYDYEMELREMPEAGDITAVSNGRGATIETKIDEAASKVIVTVKGNDIETNESNYHTYTINLTIKSAPNEMAGTITDILIDEQSLEGFDPFTLEYSGLTMTEGRYPAVAALLDPAKNSVNMTLDEENHTISIKVTDITTDENKSCTYVLRFEPSEAPVNGSQIKGDFEAYTVWGTDFSSGAEGITPDGWASSNVTQIFNFVMVEAERHELDGDTMAVLMKNGRPGFGAIASNAPGYITTGKTWVYADMMGVMGTDPDDSDGGSVGGLNFSFRPDSITGLFKRTHDTENEHGNTDEIANIYAYLWTGTATSMAYSNGGTTTGDAMQMLIDRDKDVLAGENGANLIAKAEYDIEGDLADWTRISVPFVYESDETPEKANVILSAADYFNRPNIGAGNTLSADNVEFVYNSKLESLSLFGEPIADFHKDVYEYTVPVKSMPSSGNIEAVSDGRGASISIDTDATKGIVTIIVEGNDIAENMDNCHTYTLKLNFISVNDYSADEISVRYDGYNLVVNGDYDSNLELYTVDGHKMLESSERVIPVSLDKGHIYIVRIAGKAFKIVAE